MACLPLDTVLSRKNFKPPEYSRLISLLSENKAWRVVAEAFGIFSIHDIEKFCRSSVPAETFIVELETRLCTVELFCEILQECNLYNILMLFKSYEPVWILEQPGNGIEEKMILRGAQLNLTCKAVGLPFPHYQWCCDNEELKSCNDSMLCIKNFGLENEGIYYCIVSQEGSESIMSFSVHVTLAPEKPVIVKQPPVSTVGKIGGKVVLEIVASGHPSVKYQWFKGNKQLNDSTEPNLILNIENDSQDGIYRCYVYNKAGEVWSNESRLTIYATPGPEPSAKIALLIGNQLYENLNCLNTPENDVKSLAVILKGLGFYTVTLQNLNLVEMRSVINYLGNILPKDAYVVFYFSGHGFELCDKFMLPVDAPDPENYLQSDALCERELLRVILSSQPKLFLELLDMCLKPPDSSNEKIFEEKTNLYEYEANRNLIQGYATTSYSGAYEKKSEENGLYVKYLKEYLINGKDMPIVEILRNVGKDIAKVCPLQKPFFGTNVTMDYRLTDQSLENSDLKEKIEALSLVPKDFSLYFKQVHLVSNVRFKPYLGVFLNTLEVRFSNLHDFKVSCEALGEELRFELARIKGEVAIKIMNVQKLVSNKTLTLWLSEKDGHFVDCAMWDIGKPLIAAADLWWKTNVEGDNGVRRGFREGESMPYIGGVINRSESEVTTPSHSHVEDKQIKGPLNNTNQYPRRSANILPWFQY